MFQQFCCLSLQQFVHSVLNLYRCSGHQWSSSRIHWLVFVFVFFLRPVWRFSSNSLFALSPPAWVTNETLRETFFFPKINFRYDHYATLCELLPAALPSLAYCLQSLSNGKFLSVFEMEIPLVGYCQWCWSPLENMGSLYAKVKFAWPAGNGPVYRVRLALFFIARLPSVRTKTDVCIKDSHVDSP